MPTEDDLRAAFTARAADAPAAEDVVTRLALDEPSPERRRFQVLAAAAAVIVAAAIGVPLVRSGNPSSNTAASTTQFSAAGPAAGDARPTTSEGDVTRCSEPKSMPECAAPAAALGLCATSELSLALTWQGTSPGLTGTLTATHHGSSPCYLLGPAVDLLDAAGASSAHLDAGTQSIRTLVPGGTATATIQVRSWCFGVLERGVLVTNQGRKVKVTGASAPQANCGQGKTAVSVSRWSPG